jgi:hypothetical protein
MMCISFCGENNQDVSTTNIWQLAKMGLLRGNQTYFIVNSKVLHIFAFNNYVIGEMKTAKKVFLNISQRQNEFEVVFDDGSCSPFFIASSLIVLGIIPEESIRKDLLLKVWKEGQDGKSILALTLPLIMRKVSHIPYCKR